jgi:hypothetical protein
MLRFMQTGHLLNTVSFLVLLLLGLYPPIVCCAVFWASVAVNVALKVEYEGHYSWREQSDWLKLLFTFALPALPIIAYGGAVVLNSSFPMPYAIPLSYLLCVAWIGIGVTFSVSQMSWVQLWKFLPRTPKQARLLVTGKLKNAVTDDGEMRYTIMVNGREVQLTDDQVDIIFGPHE